jgi:hypothetical protein
MKIIRGFFIAALCLVLLTGNAFSLSRFIAREEFRPVFQKGMCYTTWSKNAYKTSGSDKSLEKLSGLGVEWVAILSTWYQDNCFSTEIFPARKTPSDEGVKRAIAKAHSLGMKVMLKPHLDLLDTSQGGWRGEIACVKEADWQLWFESYKDFMLHYASLAEETGAEMLCIGTELTAATAANTDRWIDIINAIRGVYSGGLTYAANWNEEYLQIRFWDALDYAGIDAYFPLSNNDKPSYEELMEAWGRWIPEIEEWQKRINKPVIFPEIGYRSSLGAAAEPWEHIPGSVVDLELQKDCYRALVDTFWNKEWFYGAYWWDWGTNVKMGGKFNRNFTPQNKPAEDYIAEIYRIKVKR